MSTQDFVPPLKRLSSGVPGLDQVLSGGFFAGGVYIVEGVPGAGKTILANQICFHHAKEGRRVLYITLLAESHARLLQHLQDMSFFDPSCIPDRLTYVSGFRALEEGGLRGLLDLVRKELRAQNGSLIVLDGFAAVGESAETDREFKKFVHELQVHASLSPCTFFLLSSGLSAGPETVQPVHTMVDGLVRLSDHLFGVRAQRELHVAKLRGSRYLRGVHTFEISDDGVRVHPRLESLSEELVDAGGIERVSTGLPRLDAMMGGGLVRGSTTMLLGPTGVGKTILGYQFVSGSSVKEKGLLFSFYETPERALSKADGIGLNLARSCERGELEMMWESPVESSLDAIAGRLLAAVDRTRAKRLFIDGFGAFEHAAAYPERVSQFFAALQRELHRRAVTSLYTSELRQIFSPEIKAPVRGLSPLLENLLLLRFVELHGDIHRVISILKMRDSGFEAAIRQFRVREHGIDIGEDFRTIEAVLTGVAHDTKEARPIKRGRGKGGSTRRGGHSKRRRG
jgi:circadian clock protein KaiC